MKLAHRKYIRWDENNMIKTVKLEELASVKGGKRLPKGINLIATPNSHPYIRVRDLNNRRTLELNANFEYVDDETQKSIARYIVERGDIVLSIVGTIGLVAIVGDSLHYANLTENCVKLTQLNGVDRNYLYYFLKSELGQAEIAKGTVGAVQAKLPIKNIQAIDVVLPELEQQKRMASILAAIDDKIELNNKINDNLQQQIQSIFKEWFIDSTNATAWKKGTFSDLAEKTISGDWGKEEPVGNNTEKVYCIRGADIPEVRAGNKGKMPTRYILPKNYAAKKLVAGDIVVEISGGSPTQSTGRSAPISDSLLRRYDCGMVCTNFCKAIKPKQGYSMFIYYYWQYLYDTGVFFKYECGTTGIKNLNIANFMETEEILIPPTNIVKRFDSMCQTIANMIYKNGLENEHLQNLRDALLTKLMSGEIDVSTIQF